ncbi:MAG: 30S ribosomal protein S1 [Alphaproteobacteria bacterium]|jgi:small subunit ribosomal protein S1|nr:30S ribosomal protein S1 [Alphaproteobacteria bacterium]
MTPSANELPASEENFAEMLEESFGATDRLEGTVISGAVVAIENDVAVIDVGLKSEGRVPMKEFSDRGSAAELKIGDTVEVFLERMENAQGEAVLSREKARREESWTELEKSFTDGDRVTGMIFGRVKGGFTVDLSGAVAFLPGSQVDVRPVRDVGPLMGSEQFFQILKMDRRRGNIVVSRRAVLEETRAEARNELISNLHEGQVLEGVVKNITDYGAFVDLGGIDGLLHVTDMAWRRVNHPTDVLSIGDTVKVQVVRVNSETQRISLGMKQLESDPWDGVDTKYPVKTKFKGRVTNITDYGAFVELEPGVEGLVHVSEMSWTKKNLHPGRIVSTSQEIEVMVLDVDPTRRRISLGIKQCDDNPWASFAESHEEGTIISGEIKSITEFGLFVGLDGGVDGMVHLSDLSWEKSGEQAISEFEKGSTVKAKVLGVDVEKERISLGIKHLTEDPFASAKDFKKGAIVTCTVTEILGGGVNVTFGDAMMGFIRKSDLARDRGEQRPDRFAVGDKVDAKISTIDAASRKVTLSIKTLEIATEKEALAQYGSSDSGASLGDILGAAMKARGDQPAGDDGDAAADDGGDGDGKKKVAKKAAPKKAAAKKAEGGDDDEAAAAEEKPKKAAAKKAAPKKAAAKKTAKKADADDKPADATDSD